MICAYVLTYVCVHILKLRVGFSLVSVHLFAFSILSVFCFWLRLFCSCVVCFVVLGLVSSVLCQDIGWEERLQNDLSCVGVGRKTLTQSNSSLQTHYTCSFSLVIIMVALCNRETIYIFILFLSSFFSSRNLSGRRLDV